MKSRGLIKSRIYNSQFVKGLISASKVGKSIIGHFFCIDG